VRAVQAPKVPADRNGLETTWPGKLLHTIQYVLGCQGRRVGAFPLQEGVRDLARQRSVQQLFGLKAVRECVMGRDKLKIHTLIGRFVLKNLGHYLCLGLWKAGVPV
jgi:hypothetical protein